MTDELVAYLLDDLCAERRAEVERRLQTDPAWRREWERLRECMAGAGDRATCASTGASTGDAPSDNAASDLESPADSKGDSEPPRDLVKRTCCFVERACQGGQPSSASAAFVAGPGQVCSRSAWSVADLAVGAGVLFALGMLMTPALRESRDAARRLVCQDNLRSLGSLMLDYAEGHDGLLPSVDRGQNAGLYAVKLAHSGVVDPRVMAPWRMCPDSEYAEAVAEGRASLEIPTVDQLRSADDEELAVHILWMGGSYAFILGFVDERDANHPVRFTGSEFLPMAADAPRLLRTGVRSVNHGCGQYVLYQDMSVPYRANCQLSASVDNIFLNFLGRHAAGRHEEDKVLGKSGFGLDGRVEDLPLRALVFGE